MYVVLCIKIYSKIFFICSFIIIFYCPITRRLLLFTRWMGDAQLSAAESMTNFFAPAYYANWIQLMNDNQQMGCVRMALW